MRGGGREHHVPGRKHVGPSQDEHQAHLRDPAPQPADRHDGGDRGLAVERGVVAGFQRPRPGRLWPGHGHGSPSGGTGRRRAKPHPTGQSRWPARAPGRADSHPQIAAAAWLLIIYATMPSSSARTPDARLRHGSSPARVRIAARSGSWHTAPRNAARGCGAGRGTPCRGATPIEPEWWRDSCEPDLHHTNDERFSKRVPGQTSEP